MGPLLFLLYINDFPHYLERSTPLSSAEAFFVFKCLYIALFLYVFILRLPLRLSIALEDYW